MPGAKPIGVPCEDKIRATLTTTKNAVKVRVMLGDDAVKTIALGHSRRRASTFLETLARVGQWSTLDVLDKAGDVLAVVENDGEPGPMETLGEGVRVSGELARVDAHTRILTEAILRGQREVLSYRAREVDAVLGALGSVVREVTSALHAVNQAHAVERESMLEAAEHRALLSERTGKDWSEQLVEAAQALPQIAPLLPLLKSLLQGPPKVAPKAAAAAAAAKAPNGASASPPKGEA